MVGPSVGEDAFAVAVGETVVVASTDPITFTTEHIGYYAVNVNANDVATMGAMPRWFLATLLVPPGFKHTAFRHLFDELDKTCVGLGAQLCGGHTEITAAVTKPVVIGAMMGTVAKRKLVLPRRAKRGDVILMTKRLAVEGTSIIAREKPALVDAALGRRQATRARNLLFSPGISIVKEALCAVETARVHAMHDPTEGGLIWGLRELAMAAGIGVEVELDEVPIYEETSLICKRFSLDPFGLLASGSLLIVLSRSGAARVRRAIAKLGVESTEIGRMKGRGLTLTKHGKRVPVPRLRGDEIAKALDTRLAHC
jgi:hydrogenase maturation factor